VIAWSPKEVENYCFSIFYYPEFNSESSLLYKLGTETSSVLEVAISSNFSSKQVQMYENLLIYKQQKNIN